MNASAPRTDRPEAVVLSVVVPCYNEQPCLRDLYERVVTACEAVADDFELVLVDDGSQDETWPIIAQLSEGDPRVVGVKLSRNHGHQLALSAGLDVCRGRRVLVLDADLQDPPELLGDMMKEMDAGADVVYGKRAQREGEGTFKLATAHLFYRTINALSDTKIPLDTGDFRLMSRRALDALLQMPERHRFIRGMVSWIGFKQVALVYNRQPRLAGETKYPLRKMISLAADAIIAFSIKPLQLAGYLGLLTAVFGLVVLVYVGVSWLSGHVVSGWTSMMGAIALLSSVQLLTLAIIGAYLGRLYEQAKGRPLFLIEEICRGGPMREVAVGEPPSAGESTGEVDG